jgi:hypothetical protein
MKKLVKKYKEQKQEKIKYTGYLLESEFLQQEREENIRILQEINERILKNDYKQMWKNY